MIDSPYFKLLVLFGTKFPEGNKKFPQNSPGFWSAPAAILKSGYLPPKVMMCCLQILKGLRLIPPAFYLGPYPQFKHYPQFSTP